MSFPLPHPMRLALDLAAEVGADLPQTRANLAVLDAAVSAGFGSADESAVAEHLRTAVPGPTPAST
jgi:3-hydroxyisobutyrate dehydrogenase-like beta-hydroxyacid dehydrogenase